MQYDGTYYKLFSNPELVEDLLKSCVKEDWVFELDFSTLEKENSKFISDDLIRREGDLIYKICRTDGSQAYLMIMLEFQSTPDHWMSVRFLTYAGLLYQHLIKEKRLIKGVLPPVFPIVIYNGDRRWTGQRSLSKLIDLPKKSKLWSYQPQISYYLIDESDYIQRDLKSLTGLLFKLEKSKDYQDIQVYLEELLEQLQEHDRTQLARDFLLWMRHIFQPKQQLELNFDQIESISEARNMLRENAERWKQEFIQQGLIQGLEQGIEQGITLGLLLGEARILEKQLVRRFGALSVDHRIRLQNATADELDSWSLNILDAANLEDVFR